MILCSGMLNEELDSVGANTPMGPNGPHFELIYLFGMGYKGRMGSRFIFVHKGVLVIMQGCIRVSEQSLWTGLID